MADTIFAKIIRREIAADIVYEDDQVLAFRDVTPQAPTHIVIIPKKPITNLLGAEPDDTLLLGQLMQAAVHVARTLGLDESGFRVVVNVGPDGGQSVDHLHLHLLGGRPLNWPPDDLGENNPGEAAHMAPAVRVAAGNSLSCVLVAGQPAVD